LSKCDTQYSYPITEHNALQKYFFSDVIGVIKHVGPHDFASPTSQRKIQKTNYGPWVSDSFSKIKS
jgi:hypothetical protein